MIAIQTKTDNHIFNSTKGRIKMEIDLFQINFKEDSYTIRIIESVSKEVTEPRLIPNPDEEGKFIEEDYTYIKTLSSNPSRLRPMSSEQIDTISNNIDIVFEPNSLRSDIQEILRQVLLLVTQQECINGISEPGRGLWFTEDSDWEIVREPVKED